MKRLTSLVFCTAAVATLALVHHANAQSVSVTSAQQLFDEARALMNANDFAHACPKFAASQTLDPAAGTLLNLANCYEKNGQTATAWSTFKDAATAAHASNHADWEKTAKERHDALEKRLVRLTIRTMSPLAAGSTISRDGAALPPDQMGVAVPVDPGTHAIDGDAPGKKHFHESITVDETSGSKEVVIGDLSDANAPPPPLVIEPSSSSDGSTQRTLGVVLGAVGVVGIAIGAIEGISASSKNSDAKTICPNDGACGSTTAIDDASSAHSAGNVSTVGFIAGGAFLAGGAVLYFLAPKQSPRDNAAAASASLRAFPLLAPGSAGFGLRGGF